MPQLDISAFSPQIVWLVITFILLYVLMAKVALPRIGSVLEQRQNRIDDNIDMAQNLRDESKIDADTYEKKIEMANEQARKNMSDTINEMSNETSRQHEEIRVKLADEFKAAEDRIAAAKASAIDSINEAAASITSEAIAKLIGEYPEDRAVSDAISSVNNGLIKGSD